MLKLGFTQSNPSSLYATKGENMNNRKHLNTGHWNVHRVLKPHPDTIRLFPISHNLMTCFEIVRGQRYLAKSDTILLRMWCEVTVRLH